MGKFCRDFVTTGFNIIPRAWVLDRSCQTSALKLTKIWQRFSYARQFYNNNNNDNIIIIIIIIIIISQ